MPSTGSPPTGHSWVFQTIKALELHWSHQLNPFTFRKVAQGSHVCKRSFTYLPGPDKLQPGSTNAPAVLLAPARLRPSKSTATVLFGEPAGAFRPGAQSGHGATALSWVNPASAPPFTGLRGAGRQHSTARHSLSMCRTPYPHNTTCKGRGTAQQPTRLKLPAPGFASSGCNWLMEFWAASSAAVQVGLPALQPLLSPRPSGMLASPFQITFPLRSRTALPEQQL